MPRGFSSAAEFHSSQRVPVGRDWNTGAATSRLTAPRIVTRAGVAIQPISFSGVPNGGAGSHRRRPQGGGSSGGGVNARSEASAEPADVSGKRKAGALTRKEQQLVLKRQRQQERQRRTSKRL